MSTINNDETAATSTGELKNSTKMLASPLNNMTMMRVIEKRE